MTLDIRFDFQRIERIGLFEAIWGEDKTINQLKEISKLVLSKKEIVFITRITKNKAKNLLDIYPEAKFYEDANCLIIAENPKKISSEKK